MIRTKFGFNERKWETTRADFNRRVRVLERVQFGQHWFMLNRLFDDYIYHSVVRPQAIKYAKDKGWNVFRFSDEETKAVEQFSFQKVKDEIRPIMNRMALLNVSHGNLYVCETVKNYNFSLPWGRTFEAEIDFQLDCKKLDNPKVKPKKL